MPATPRKATPTTPASSFSLSLSLSLSFSCGMKEYEQLLGPRMVPLCRFTNVEIYRKFEPAEPVPFSRSVGGALSNHGDPSWGPLSRRRSSAFFPVATASRYLPHGPPTTDATHLMRFFDRMRGALTAAPTRLLPVNHIPHAAPTTLSPKPKAMPKLA